MVLDLAAAGVDVLRLDAVPFLWKRRGTDCQNQPEVHEILQALPGNQDLGLTPTLYETGHPTRAAQAQGEEAFQRERSGAEGPKAAPEAPAPGE